MPVSEGCRRSDVGAPPRRARTKLPRRPSPSIRPRLRASPYPEDESRLSDVALDWMLGAASAVGLQYDPSVLRLHPDALGMQHDETRSLVFRFAPKKLRRLRDDAPLHPSVIERLGAPAVHQYDVDAPYRPENLRTHRQAGCFFTTRESGDGE